MEKLADQTEEEPQLSTPLSTRTQSDTNLYGPIRRRSLLQHGVATRTSWIENDSRQSQITQTQSEVDLQNYYYNPSKPTSSPLDELAALAPKFQEGPRAETPTGSDYAHIGAFALGSLRITNGAASPAPSDGRPSTREEDYIKASVGKAGAQRHQRDLSELSNMSSIPGDVVAPWIKRESRAESPLRQEYREVEEFEPLEIDSGTLFKGLSVDTHLPLPEFSLFKFTESPKRSLELANEYMQDLALSPFSFDNSPPASPTLQATSKHMAIEDDLFEPEPGTPEVSEFRVHKSFDSGYQAAESPVETKKLKGPRDLGPKPLAKADSGYSSNVSLRSFRGNPPVVPAKEAPPTPPKETVSRDPISRPVSSVYSTISTASAVSDATIAPSRESLQVPFGNGEYSTIYAASESVPALRNVSVTSEYSTVYAPSAGSDETVVRPGLQSRVASATSEYSTVSDGTVVRPQVQSRVPSATSEYSTVSGGTVVRPQVQSRIPSTTSTYSTTSASAASDLTLRTKRSLPALPREPEPRPVSQQRPPIPSKQSFQNGSPATPSKSPAQNWSPAAYVPQGTPPAAYVPQGTHKPKHERSQSIPNDLPQKTSVARLARKDRKSSQSPSGSDGSNSSSGSTSRWRKRSSSKSRPNSLQPQPVYTVQAFHSPAEQLSIPSVPKHASKHLEERVDSFPVASFPNSWNESRGLRRSTSKETLGTIFSVGSAELREELTVGRLHAQLPSVPVHSPIQESPLSNEIQRWEVDGNRRNTYGAPTPPAQAPVSRKPVRQSLQAQPARKESSGLQKKLQQDFETQITSFDGVSSSLGRSPYDAAIDTTRSLEKQKAKSMTAQLEADAAARFAQQKNMGQSPYGSAQSMGIQQRRTTSYDSLPSQNPAFLSSTNSPSNIPSRKEVGTRSPPQAHAKFSGVGVQRPYSLLPARRSNPNLQEVNGFMGLGNGSKERIRSPPPVSMKTQRKSLPASAKVNTSAPPARIAPSAPEPALKETKNDPWSQQRNFWAERKAEAAVQSRKSLDLKRPESARSSTEYQRPQMPHSLAHHGSFDSRPRESFERPKEVRRDSGIFEYGSKALGQEWKQREGSYDHTYGSGDYPSSSTSDKENRHQVHPSIPTQQLNRYGGEQEPEYYADENQDTAFATSLHESHNSTSEMLILDRFAGGLGYGYDPGYGIGGSAGTRNTGRLGYRGENRKSVRESERWGVDLSDVPVFLRQVGVRN
jgi:hypothetical protein